MLKNLFRKKIKVELIGAIEGESYGSVKLAPEQLPDSFPPDKETIIHIEGIDWIVDRAEPIHSQDFVRKGELTLWIKKVLKFDPSDIRFSVPTISNELPAVSTDRLYYDFILTIHEDDWRQTEFIPVTELDAVQQEMKKIESIIFPDGERDLDASEGFSAIHVRTIKRTSLAIPWLEFIQLLNVNQQGALAINGHAGYVQNGFACKTGNHTYYGTINDGFITEISVDDFDSMDEETSILLKKYQLLLVCWCRGTITSS